MASGYAAYFAKVAGVNSSFRVRRSTIPLREGSNCGQCTGLKSPQSQFNPGPSHFFA